MSVVQNILRRCQAVALQNKAKKITVIAVEIGDFTMIVEDIFLRLFDIAKGKTMAKDATLKITKTPGVISCHKCQLMTEIWFQDIQDNLDIKQQKNLSQFKSGIEANGILTQNKPEGRNIFQCEHCGSGETTLVKGKNILIKNIQVG